MNKEEINIKRDKNQNEKNSKDREIQDEWRIRKTG